MARLVDITLDGVTTELQYCNYAFKRQVDEHRRPQTRIKIENGFLCKWDPLEDRDAILNWLNIKNTEQGKSCEINFYLDDEKSKVIQCVKMENAHIVEYNVEFTDQEGIGMSEVFRITAEKMDINGVKYDEQWPQV